MPSTLGLFDIVTEVVEDVAVIKVAKYASTDKIDLSENEEYGYCSLIKATNSVLNKMKIKNTTMQK